MYNQLFSEVCSDFGYDYSPKYGLISYDYSPKYGLDGSTSAVGKVWDIVALQTHEEIMYYVICVASKVSYELYT